MHSPSRISIILALIFALAAAAQAAPDVLTLPQSLEIAMKGNRQLQNVNLDVRKSKDNKAIDATRLYPSMNVHVLAGQLLEPVEFQFDKGSLGTLPGVGPVPATDQTISAGPNFATNLVVTVRQPLLQLPKIQLSVKKRETDTAVSVQEVQAQRQSLALDVKKSYYSLLQTQSQLDADREDVLFYQELVRELTNQYKQQQILLSSLLEAKGQLAASTFDLTKTENALQTNRQQFNYLLGRDIDTRFRVVAVGETAVSSLDLASLQGLALKQKPQMQQALLKLKAAELERRIKIADNLPDLSMSFDYIKPYNAGPMPDHFLHAGLEFKWQPVDWGQRHAELDKATQSLLQARNNVVDVHDQVLIDVSTQYGNVHAAREAVSSAHIVMAAAVENLRVTRNQYAQQTVTLKTLLHARYQYLNARRQYLSAVLGFDTAVAELELAVGEE